MSGPAETVGLGFGALVLLSVYLLSNLLIGLFAYRSGGTWTARDYFLGGKTTGALVLFFAMLATKFSGNTFFGLPGQAYRIGLMSVLLVPFMVAIAVGFLSYAPRLYVLSKKYDYLTPADFYADRFQSRPLRLIVACFLILSVIPYLMIQATGMGHAFVRIHQRPVFVHQRGRVYLRRHAGLCAAEWLARRCLGRGIAGQSALGLNRDCRGGAGRVRRRTG